MSDAENNSPNLRTETTSKECAADLRMQLDAAEKYIDELQERIRDQAKGHQEDARCWQIERHRLIEQSQRDSQNTEAAWKDTRSEHTEDGSLQGRQETCAKRAQPESSPVLGCVTQSVSGQESGHSVQTSAPTSADIQALVDDFMNFIRTDLSHHKWEMHLKYLFGKAAAPTKSDREETNRQVTTALMQSEAENWRLREALRMCATRAGIADPSEACRMVIATVKEALHKNNYVTQESDTKAVSQEEKCAMGVLGCKCTDGRGPPTKSEGEAK